MQNVWEKNLSFERKISEKVWKFVQLDSVRSLHRCKREQKLILWFIITCNFYHIHC